MLTGASAFHGREVLEKNEDGHLEVKWREVEGSTGEFDRATIKIGNFPRTAIDIATKVAKVLTLEMATGDNPVCTPPVLSAFNYGGAEASFSLVTKVRKDCIQALQTFVLTKGLLEKFSKPLALSAIRSQIEEPDPFKKLPTMKILAFGGQRTAAGRPRSCEGEQNLSVLHACLHMSTEIGKELEMTHKEMIEHMRPRKNVSTVTLGVIEVTMHGKKNVITHKQKMCIGIMKQWTKRSR